MAGDLSGYFGPSGGAMGSAGPQRRAGNGLGNSFKYPSPWWDVAQMRMPTSFRALLEHCRYHAVFNPLVRTVVHKMAAYPITDIIIDAPATEGFNHHKDRWENLLLHELQLQRKQVEIGLDRFAFGNAIISIKFPFKKWLVCPACGQWHRIDGLRYKKQWSFRNFEYILKCTKCSYHDRALVRDRWVKSPKGIKLIRWSPQDISIDFNPITQESEYQYKIPASLKKKVAKGHRRTLETMPHSFILAMKRKKKVVLDPTNVYHFKAPTVSLTDNDNGWGYPLILAALKDSFYLQIMKKSQEAVLLEHMLPLDIFYPATGDQAANPFVNMNLGNWKARIENELKQWRRDPNRKPVMPLPIGHQRIGGNGRALLLTQEIRAWSEHIIAGMDVPQEFVFGGLTWSGSSVSLRMLENKFLNYRIEHHHFLRYFLIPHLSQFLGWPEIKVKMKQFKMADDVQSKQMLMNLANMGKISDTELLSEFGLDAAEQLESIKHEFHGKAEVKKLEAVAQGEIAAKQQEIQQVAQIELQQKMQKKMQKMQKAATPEQPTQQVDLRELAQGWASGLKNMGEPQRNQYMARMRAESPLMAEQVSGILNGGQAVEVSAPAPSVRPSRSATPTM